MRACEKKVLHLRHPESGIFDEVYFVLREDVMSTPSHRDMVEEAERIIRREAREKDVLKKKDKRLLLLVALILLLGSACAVMLTLLLFF